MHELSRRELLATFLLPAAFSGCTQPAAEPLPDGEIVGASDGFGHRLRDTAPDERAVPAERWRSVPVVIVGGGVAGLAAAWRLKRAGFADFVHLELEPAPGGTARSGRSSVTAYPWGAHYVPVPLKENRALIALLDEMGVLEGRDEAGDPVAAEPFRCRDPEERTFYKGRWYEGLYLHAGARDDDLAQLARFHQEVGHWVQWRDGKGRRAFTLPIADCSDDAYVTVLDKLSMADWLDQHQFSSPRLRWLVEYGCRDDYGTTLETTSAWAGLFYFAARLRRAGAESRPLLTWPEGNGRLVNHLAGKVSERLELGVAAAEVMPTDAARKPRVDVVAVAAKGGPLLGYHAERVIFAAPQFLTRFLLRPYRQQPPAHVAQFEYGAWMVANLSLRGRPQSVGFPLAWDNVLYESPALGYVVATHQRGLDHGPTVFTYYYPLCDANPRTARSRLLQLGWAEWAEVALADLRRAHPDLRGLVERLDVMRWGHAMVRPRPGFLWGGSRAAAVRPYRGVHFAHCDLSGVALFEEAFYHGVRAAEEVLAARGHRFESLL